ncbi:Hypothetical predicted protein [Mytilus galloprovincialis]|uniref:LRAT domain-containing protein n=1 Tax=Mytilus galloprovincialis TaxID=29158 RepID=A0A8B6FL32_MYTGA|nr:Hypothetical predicted protein [Mytilus galloprovincialis]
MGKSKKYKVKKIWTRNDYALRHSNQQRSPSEETVRVLTMQTRNVPEKTYSFMKKPEDDEITKYPEHDEITKYPEHDGITKYPEIDDSNKIEDTRDTCDDIYGRRTQNSKPVACLECVKPIQVFTSEEIKRGDHIKFHGRIYDHHAIVIDVKPSNKKDHKVDLELVHASNTTAGAIYNCMRPFGNKAKLLTETKRINLKKIKVMVYKYSDTIDHFSPKEIVTRAVTTKSNPDFKYNLLNNNCEHFTTWCVTGEGLSLQIRKIRMVKGLFVNGGFQGIGDEALRNKIEFDKGMLCAPCFERNKNILNVKKQPIRSKSDVKIGDIITYTYYRCLHSAVVLEIKSHDRSLQCKIAHYAFRGLHRDRKIREDTLRIPFDGSVKVTDFSTDYTVYAPEEVVERARSKLGEKRYAHFSNDSSHFARWCKLKLYRNCNVSQKINIVT